MAKKEPQQQLAGFLDQVLAKLREARDALLVAGPDTLESFAAVLEKITDAALRAAELLRQYGGEAPAGAQAAPADLEPLRQFRAEVEQLTKESPPGAQAGPFGGGLLKGLLAQVLSELVKKLLGGLGG